MSVLVESLRASLFGDRELDETDRQLAVLLGGLFVTVPLALSGLVFWESGCDRIGGGLTVPLWLNVIFLMCVGH